MARSNQASSRAVDCNSIHSQPNQTFGNRRRRGPLLEFTSFFCLEGNNSNVPKLLLAASLTKARTKTNKKIKFCLLQLLPPQTLPLCSFAPGPSNHFREIVPDPREDTSTWLLGPGPVAAAASATSTHQRGRGGRAGCCCYARAPLRRSGSKLRPGAH